MLELKNINVIFGKGTSLENHVLKNINLTVKKCEFVTVIGGNGAGKSTLMNLIAGDILPTTGDLWIDGMKITRKPTEERAAYISRVFQDPMIGTCADMTIEENLSLAATRGKKRGLHLSINDDLRQQFKQRLSILNIGLENRLDDKVALLSGGQRQALSLIMCSFAPSKIVLLDEHTAALDPKMAKLVIELTQKIVEQFGLTALMITQSMTQALEYGSRTIMMYHGSITRDIHGKNRALLKPEELLEFFDLAQ